MFYVPSRLQLLVSTEDSVLMCFLLVFSRIRSKGLVQYFSPYLSADLRLMAESFKTSVARIEEELVNLILEGQIHARIDSHNKVKD